MLFLYYTFLLGDLPFGYKEKGTTCGRKPFDQKIGSNSFDFFLAGLLVSDRSGNNPGPQKHEVAKDSRL